MMRFFLPLAFLLSTSVFAQNKIFRMELGYHFLTAVGDNFIKDGLGSFNGLGGEVNAVVYKNVGVGLGYSRTFSTVKNEAIYGSLKEPQLSVLGVYIFYRHRFTPRTASEAEVGINDMRIKSKSYYSKDFFREGGSAGFFGIKGLYSISYDNVVSIVVGSRLYIYDSNLDMKHSAVQNYYSQALFLNFNAGISIAF